MEYIRTSPEARRVVIINDPQPVSSVGDIWSSAGRAAMIGIFLLLFVAFLYFGRAILLPIFAAAIVALTLAPGGQGRQPPRHFTLDHRPAHCRGLPRGAEPRRYRHGRTGERMGRTRTGDRGQHQGEAFRASSGRWRRCSNWKKYCSARARRRAAPSAPSVVLPVVAFVTPAAGELLLFFGTLMFFLVGQIELRAQLVSFFATRDAKLRFLKIVTDIERNLASYLAIVTVINASLGVVVALGAFALGFPNPAIFGVLAALLNYVPYVGPAVMVVILFVVGLVSFPSLGQAFIAPLAFVLLTTMEGHFITPTVVGRRVTLNPLLIFLALAFWTWMWGPIGAFLAAPLSIIGLVVVNHLVPSEDVKLPE